MKMETAQKVFEMSENPRTGKVNKIIVERPEPDSVWYLVIDKSKQFPLVNLTEPFTAKDVLDELAKAKGDGGVSQYMMEGYSKL